MPINHVQLDATNFDQITIDEVPNFQLNQSLVDQLYAQLQANAMAFGHVNYFWTGSTQDTLVKTKPKMKLNLPDWW